MTFLERLSEKEGRFKVEDIVVDQIGLVERGANESPFFMIKGGKSMDRDELREKLAKLRQLDEVDRDAWDELIQVVGSFLEDEEEVEGSEEEPTEFENALDTALALFHPFVEEEELDEELAKAVENLAKLAGYPYPYQYPHAQEYPQRYPYPYPVRQAGSVQEAVKESLRVLWPFVGREELSDAIEVLGGFVGYPKPEGYPEPVEREADGNPLEKSLEETKGELEKAKAQVAELKKAQRLAELEQLSKKAMNVEPETLYDLEKASPELFETITKKLRAAQERVEQGALFEEVGKSTPSTVNEPGRTLIDRAEAMSKDREDVDFSRALEIISKEDPELYREYRKSR